MLRKLILGLGLLLGLTLAGLALLAPKEPVDLVAFFDATQLSDGIDPYLQRSEARFDDIVPGTEKRMVWATAPETRAPWTVVYVHGFSATSEEIRPVPDRVAQGLGANLFFTRLAGHGRGGPAMAEPVVQDWMADMAEALAIGRATGDRVLVISTSTGGTLTALAALDPDLSQQMDAVVMVSPNFGLMSPTARILTWPGVRWWGPKLAGAERSFEPSSPAHAQFWTTRYPTVALIPMAAAVEAALTRDMTLARVPALVVMDDRDQIVDPMMTRAVMSQWGGPTRLHGVVTGPGDDPRSHVIAGDILSPGQTDGVVQAILDWAQGL